MKKPKTVTLASLEETLVLADAVQAAMAQEAALYPPGGMAEGVGTFDKAGRELNQSVVIKNQR